MIISGSRSGGNRSARILLGASFGPLASVKQFSTG